MSSVPASVPSKPAIETPARNQPHAHVPAPTSSTALDKAPNKMGLYIGIGVGALILIIIIIIAVT
jgi:hypothetical protein